MKKPGFTGLKDTDKVILLELKYPDLVNACEYDDFTKSICNDENFWKSYLLKNYNVTGNEAAKFLGFFHFDKLKDLTEYFYNFGEDVKYVFRMLRDKIVDTYIGYSLRDPYFNREANFLHKYMRREIPRLILNNTDEFTIFYFSTIRNTFGSFFIEVEPEFQWILVEPKYLNKSKLLPGRTPVRARKTDVAEGVDWTHNFWPVVQLKEYAANQWAKLN